MKLIFRDIGQTQRFKCGEDSFGAALLGVGASVIGSEITSEQSKANVNKQLNSQKQENQKNRDWQSGEAETSRQYGERLFNKSLQQQTSERLGAEQFQANQWQHQFQEELSHRFDIPQGVNPAVYFSNHGAAAGVGGSVSSPTTGSPSSPSGSMPSGVAGLNAVGYQPMNLQVPQLMSSLGSMMSGLANAKKAGVETDFLEKSLRDRLRQAMSNADMAQIAVALGELDKKFQESTLPDRVKKVAAEYKQVLTDIDLTGEKILTEKEEQRLKRVTSDLNDALADYNKSAKQKLDIEIQYLPNLIQSQILSNRGSAAAGFGAGQKYTAEAQTENDIRKYRVEAQRLLNEGYDNENRFNTATFLDRVQSIVRNNDLLGNKNLMLRIENSDKEAYNAFWRIFHGRGSGEDAKRVLKMLSNIDLYE